MLLRYVENIDSIYVWYRIAGGNTENFDISVSSF